MTNKPSWEGKEKRYRKFEALLTKFKHQEIGYSAFIEEIEVEFTQREQEIENGLKKLTVVTYVGKGGKRYERVLLDEALELLKGSNNNTK